MNFPIILNPKKIVLSFLTLVTLGVSAQIVTIPDANFKAYLVGNATINTGGDPNEIELTEAAAFTGQINCSNLSITDLTGIEEFTDITVLYAGSNQISNIDCSQNINLTTLFLNSNQLTMIDLSNNTLLTGLYLENNQLNMIDLSNNSLLTTLNVNNNQLNDLDLSNNLQLTDLSCAINQIGMLDVLSQSLLINLFCHTNLLSDLDLSSNLNLEYLQCGANLLNSLNVLNNINLISIGCGFNQLNMLTLPTGNILEILNCSDNQLVSLDLSSYSILTQLFCQNNTLTSLNIANGNNTNMSMSFSCTGNPNLTCIQVDNVTYANNTWSFVVDPTANFNTNCDPNACVLTIPDANFKQNLVGDMNINTNNDSEIQCSEAIAFTGQINCSNLSITDLTGIEEFINLTELVCSNNQISNIDVTDNIYLSFLNCDNNTLSTLDVSQNLSITTLFCSNNQLSSLDVNANTDLSQFHCNGNSITQLNLTFNTDLLHLHCYDNSISNLDLTQNLNLQTLYCSDNLLSTLDITLNVLLIDLYCDSNQLINLHVANGNNSNFIGFQAFLNSNLECIEVDNVAYSTTNWTQIDSWANYSTNCGFVNIEEITNNLELTTYPNPTTGNVTFTNTDISSASISSIEIYNLAGQIVAIFTNTNTINVSNLSDGLYTAKITSDQQVGVVKLIKE